MESDQKSGFAGGLWAAVPIALGYFPIAFAFGVAATGAGLSGPEAFGLSLIIFSGAAQFLAITLIAGGVPLLIAAPPLVAMGLRHLLYGPALMQAAGAGAPRRHAWAWAFGLTDEVFGVALGAMARGQRFSEGFMFGLAAGAYGAWLAGTALGAYAGSGALSAYPAVEAGLSFLLPGIFLALLLSILSRGVLPAIAVATLATLGIGHAVSPIAGVLGGMLAGALAGAMGGGRDAQ